MFARISHNLNFQIIAALMSLLMLFTGAISYTFVSLEQQLHHTVIVNLAAKLQLTAQHLAGIGMKYEKARAMMDASHDHDIPQYFDNLKIHVNTFDGILDAFMFQDFRPQLTGLGESLKPSLGTKARKAVATLENTWIRFRTGLFEALGTDIDNPRLEQAAHYVSSNYQALEDGTDELSRNLQDWASREVENINFVNRLVLVFAFIITIGIIFSFFRKVLKPLGRTVTGFNHVARGNFGLQLPEEGSAEIAQLTRSFNQLSRRLHALFSLIDRLQRGSDLDEILAFVADEFRDLLHIDWVGVVFLTGDGNAAQLQGGYLNGKKEIVTRQVYRLQGTLLERALRSDDPLHIQDMEKTAAENEAYEFLRMLTGKGLKDAIFLPLRDQSPVPGVLVFAADKAHTYSSEQLELLANIAHLVTHSFTKTVRLSEHSRLAAIGEFASGIAHEIRSPLATIGIALDYFKKAELPGTASKRAELASQEAERMARLLDDMLLYAKPLNLNMETLSVVNQVAAFIDKHTDLAAERGQRFVLKSDGLDAPIMGDPDRLTQVFLNLARNACDAAPERADIHWHILDQPDLGSVSIVVQNPGETVPQDILPRLTEPFFTTKSSGTGLGLGIVKRIVNGHGGDIHITSDVDNGTQARITFPRLPS